MVGLHCLDLCWVRPWLDAREQVPNLCYKENYNSYQRNISTCCFGKKRSPKKMCLVYNYIWFTSQLNPQKGLSLWALRAGKLRIQVRPKMRSYENFILALQPLSLTYVVFFPTFHSLGRMELSLMFADFFWVPERIFDYMWTRGNPATTNACWMRVWFTE